jgi:hypothetical protein
MTETQLEQPQRRGAATQKPKAVMSEKKHIKNHGKHVAASSKKQGTEGQDAVSGKKDGAKEHDTASSKKHRTKKHVAASSKKHGTKKHVDAKHRTKGTYGKPWDS